MIRDNLAETPVYGGWVDARGPRWVHRHIPCMRTYRPDGAFYVFFAIYNVPGRLLSMCNCITMVPVAGWIWLNQAG